jgi:hypothetical protein
MVKKRMESLRTIPKETIFKDMAAKISKLSQHVFFDLVREFPLNGNAR